MNANRENDAEDMSAAMGNPFRRVILNIAGAFPAMARPSVCAYECASSQAAGPKRRGLETRDLHNARELVYRSLEAADQAEVRRAALMICGNP
jgi:hypothetical protein